MAAQANPAAAMAPGKALENLGHAIEQTGEAGMQLVGRVRQVDEGGKINAYLADAQRQAGDFANQLATRSDTDAWTLDWRNKAEELRQGGKNLGLSPEATARLDAELLDFSTRHGIKFEHQASFKKTGIARARTQQALEYQMGRGEKEEFDRTLGVARDSGIYNPAEIERAQQVFSNMESAHELKAMLERDPQGVMDLPDEHFLNALPGISLEQIERGRSAAKAKLQEFRSGEMDTLEAALDAGTIHPRDVEAARFVSPKDRASLLDALGQKDPPSNENHGKAWDLLGTLRKARQDPSVTPDQYREIFNETRGDVLRRIAPRWQGDLKQELSYLSPAGRSTDAAKVATAYERGDLEAQGRDVAFRARDAGLFGNVADDAPPADKEKAYRRADEIRLSVKRFVAGKPEATPEEVWGYVDSLISRDRAKTTAASLQSFVPGAAQRLRPRPADPTRPDLPAGEGTATPSLLPPAQQLENFLK